jgi:hypothetical protein
MSQEDIRWIQRFNNFSNALSQLRKFIAKGEMNELEEQGLIQAFEYTYELAWNSIKDYFETQTEEDSPGKIKKSQKIVRYGIFSRSAQRRRHLRLVVIPC